jgi:hypothetical protein
MRLLAPGAKLAKRLLVDAAGLRFDETLEIERVRCGVQWTPARSSSGSRRPFTHRHHILKSAPSDQIG